jgi:hypothetical protein
MEYWIPWGSTEVFFEAPPELSVTTPSPTPLTYEEVLSRVSAIPDTPCVFIDYLPTPTAYKTLLARLAETCKIAYVSSWRLGIERVGEAVAELESLEKKPPLAPLKEFADETSNLESATFIYPLTSRLLLSRVATSTNEYLAWLFKIHGISGLDPFRINLFPVEISYSIDGSIHGIWTQNPRPDHKPPVFDSVIVSPGKAPLDSTLYLAAQSIILSSSACGDETTILAVSECKEGLGPPEFVRQLYESLKPDLEGELSPDADPYKLIAAGLATALRSYRTYMVTSLPRSLAKLLIGIKTFETVQEGFAQILRLHGRGHRMLLVREGLHIDPGMVATG